jgi:hypothetical protein
LPNIAFGLAASATEIGLAWADGNGALHFTRLQANLSVLSDDCIAALSFDAVSVASTSTGWLVAAHGHEADMEGGIFLYPLDRTGTAIGSRQFLRAPQNGGSPCGFRNFTGGPTLSRALTGNRMLLSWREDSLDAFFGKWLGSQVLAEDGHVVGMQGRLDVGTSIVALADGFEAAGNNNGGPRLLHIALDGTVREDAMLPSLDSTILAWSGSTIRLLYRTSPPYPSTQPGPTFVQRISAAGALLGNPTPIDAGAGNDLDDDTLLALGPDSVVHVTQSANSHHSEALVRLDSTGAPVLPPLSVAHANSALKLQTVAQGSDAVVAWIAPSNSRPTRLELARVRLAP